MDCLTVVVPLNIGLWVCYKMYASYLSSLDCLVRFAERTGIGFFWHLKKFLKHEKAVIRFDECIETNGFNMDLFMPRAHIHLRFIQVFITHKPSTIWR